MRIGITCDTAAPHPKDAGLGGHRYESPAAYAQAVVQAGATALLLPFHLDQIDDCLDLCDGFVLAGGDDPDTTAFGEPVHDQAKPVHPKRQAFELALLSKLDATGHPVLGICLGMQWMSLHHGGKLDQYLPETLDPKTASVHAEGEHAVVCCVPAPHPLPPEGAVHSHHRQAVVDAGRLRVCARSDRASGQLIEAVDLPGERFYLGVQWHPERTAQRSLGQGLVQALVEAAKVFRQSTSNLP